MNTDLNQNRDEVYKVELNPFSTNDARVHAFNQISESSTVLDIGCACGDFGVILKNKKKCSLYGMEYNRGSIDIALDTGAYTAIHQVDLNLFDPNNFSQFNEMFDYITLLDVLEHLLNPEQVLKNLKPFLKPKGSFIISLPNIAHGSIKANLLQNNFAYSQTGILDCTHLKFFTHKSIVKLLSDENLVLDGVNSVVSADFYSSKDYYGKSTTLSLLTDLQIRLNTHSYIYQYVVTSKLSTLSYKDLFETNKKLLSIKWKTIFKRVAKEELYRIKNKLIKQGNPLHTLLKKVRDSLA